MLDVLGQDFIRTARAKGLTRRQALFKHGLRTALIPMATLFAYSVGGLFTGAVFVEKIFGWHGMGEWVIQGITTQDTNIVVAITVFTGVTILLAGLLSDVIYAALDPGCVWDDGHRVPRMSVSRRTLVLRRFLRNRPAVISLVVLALLFVGCWLLPPLLPYCHTDLDYLAAAAADDDALVRHQLDRPGPAGPDAARHAEVVADRCGGGVHLHPDRRHRRRGGRVLRRLARPHPDVDRRPAAGRAELPAHRDRDSPHPGSPAACCG